MRGWLKKPEALALSRACVCPWGLVSCVIPRFAPMAACQVDQVIFNGTLSREELRDELFYADGQGHPGERCAGRVTVWAWLWPGHLPSRALDWSLALL